MESAIVWAPQSESVSAAGGTSASHWPALVSVLPTQNTLFN